MLSTYIYTYIHIDIKIHVHTYFVLTYIHNIHTYITYIHNIHNIHTYRYSDPQNVPLVFRWRNSIQHLFHFLIIRNSDKLVSKKKNC